MRNQSGATLFEVMIVSAILALSALALSSAVTYMQKSRSKVYQSSSREKIVSGLLESIRNEINQFQLNYQFADPATGLSELDVNTLPTAWSAGVITTKEQCPSCPGRMGYVIHPLLGYNGLYIVTARITHPELNGNKPVDYQFIVSGR